MLHLLAYTKASAGGVTLEDLPGVQDGWATLSGSSHYLLPQNMLVRAIYSLSPNLTAEQISQPTLRRVALPSAVPYDIGTGPTSLPAIDWLYHPYFQLGGTDELAVLQSDNAAGAIQKYAFILLQDQDVRNLPQGNVIQLRATAAITVGNKVWGAGTITLDQGIPYGQYAIVGMDVVGANLIAARLVFPTGGNKPGVIARTSHANKPSPRFRNGDLGVFGYFNSTALPSVELFGSAAPTTQEFFIDVIKTG